MKRILYFHSLQLFLYGLAVHILTWSRVVQLFRTCAEHGLLTYMYLSVNIWVPLTLI